MTLADDISPQFQSFQGLHQVVTTRSKMQVVIKDILKWIKAGNGSNQLDRKYMSIRLLDTFLSDSLDDEVLGAMLEMCVSHQYEMKILVLDPLSQFARTRAETLGLNPIAEINKTLFNLRNALLRVQDKRCLASRELKVKSRSYDFIGEQLQALENQCAGAKVQLAVKFYELLTEIPTYIVSQFVAKGLIIHGRTAAHNPWMIIVDDETQRKDLYDFLSDNFDAVWDSDSSRSRPSEEIDRGSRHTGGVFISHGRNRAVMLEVRRFVQEKLRLKPVVFEEKAKAGFTITENFERMARRCSSAIIILTKEDEQADGEQRARQNVIHELGYLQALYGREEVILLKEKGVETPSNIAGQYYEEFEADQVKACFEFLRQHLQSEPRNGQY